MQQPLATAGDGYNRLPPSSDGDTDVDPAPLPDTSVPADTDVAPVPPPVALPVAPAPPAVVAEWPCPRCTTINAPGEVRCEACGHAPGAEAPAEGVPFDGMYAGGAGMGGIVPGIAVGIPMHPAAGRVAALPPRIAQVDDILIEHFRVQMFRWALAMLCMTIISLWLFPLSSILALSGGGMVVYWTRDRVMFLHGGDTRGCCNRDTSLTAHVICCAFASFFQVLSLVTTAYEVAVGDAAAKGGHRPPSAAAASMLLLCGALFLAVLLINTKLALRLRVQLAVAVAAAGET